MDRKRRNAIGTNYPKYRVAAGDTVPEVSGQLTSEQFYERFIEPRKPAKFTVGDVANEIKLDKTASIVLDRFVPANLVKTTNWPGELQVERKYGGGFGSGEDRLRMSLGDLLEEFNKGDGGYYLTTQYEVEEEQEVEEEEDESEEEESEEGVLKEEVLKEEEEGEQNQEAFDSDESDEVEEEPEYALGINSIKPANDADDAEENSSDSDSFDMENLHDDYEESNPHSDPIVNSTLELTRSEAKHRISELYQKPLTNLASRPDILPMPSYFSMLVPQQINLWMGLAQTSDDFSVDPNDKNSLGKYIPGGGTSSGLHHDHADNLYVLIQGRKRFTLYSPADAEKLYTVGTIYKIFSSGIIDYTIDEKAPHWKHIREDGAIIDEILQWKQQQGEDPEVLAELRRTFQSTEKSTTAPEHGASSVTPPNFSTVPPSLLHIDEFDEHTQQVLVTFAEKYFPGFLQLNKLTVWIEPGEMLYLPAGWFHEVSSFGGNESNVHVALNYWFMPPSDDAKVYADDYWHSDYERTLASLQVLREHPELLEDEL